MNKVEGLSFGVRRDRLGPVLRRLDCIQPAKGPVRWELARAPEDRHVPLHELREHDGIGAENGAKVSEDFLQPGKEAFAAKAFHLSDRPYSGGGRVVTATEANARRPAILERPSGVRRQLESHLELRGRRFVEDHDGVTDLDRIAPLQAHLFDAPAVDT